MARRSRGERGERGRAGTRGKQGVKGLAGARGKAGARGPIGPTTSRSDILAAVADQFESVSHQLDTQLTRIAQLQQQLDKQAKGIEDVRAEVVRVRDVLANLVHTPQ